MKKVRLKYWCNAGHTEEEVELEVPYDMTEKEFEDFIQDDFLSWLDNNEQCGWEKL
jgi:hypothetical protein